MRKDTIIPLILVALPVIASRLVDRRYTIYVSLVCFSLVILYLWRRGYYSAVEWREAVSDRRRLALGVAITLAAAVVAYFLGEYISSAALKGKDAGRALYVVSSWPGLVSFAVTTIALPAVAEEALFRKGLVDLGASNATMAVGVVVGSVLYGFEHSANLWGAFPMMLVGTIFGISYVRTRNVFVPMIAHFSLNLVANGTTVVSLALRLAKVR